MAIADNTRTVLEGAVIDGTHVGLSDDHVGLPASHCDIDRATRLLEVLAYR